MHHLKNQYRYTKFILLVASESSYRNKLACTNTRSSISNASLARLVRLSTFAEDSTKFKKVIREVAANENKNLNQTYSEDSNYVIIVPSNSNSEFKNMLVQLINVCVLTCCN